METMETMEKLRAARPSARILVAEDNIINREVLLNQLRNLGYFPDAVEVGLQAVEAVRNNHYDIVLMGCRMPEMDGFEATSAIRFFEGTSRHTTIIAVTAHVFPGDREKCLAAGMDDYLGKPVKTEVLNRMLDRWTASGGLGIASTPAKLDLDSEYIGIVDPSFLDSYGEFQEEGEPDLVSKLIDLFISDTLARLQSLKNAIIAGDSETIKMQAHTIKGASGNVGAVQMAALCDRIYQTHQLSPRAEGLISELEDTFEHTTRILNSMRQHAVV